jgi:hypothetical protein
VLTLSFVVFHFDEHFAVCHFDEHFAVCHFDEHFAVCHFDEHFAVCHFDERSEEKSLRFPAPPEMTGRGQRATTGGGCPYGKN